jgi:hypothetical protein
MESHSESELSDTKNYKNMKYEVRNKKPKEKKNIGEILSSLVNKETSIYILKMQNRKGRSYFIKK